MPKTITQKVEAIHKLLQGELSKQAIRSKYYAQPYQFEALYLASQTKGIAKLLEDTGVVGRAKIVKLKKERKALIKKIKGESDIEVYSMWETRVKDIELEIKAFDKRRK